MNTARQVAHYFLSFTDEEAGEFISNMKLQKLCYYAQGFHLALTGKPLFPESIEAWTHGPVIPALYRSYKGCGAGAILPNGGFDPSVFDKDTRALMDEVFEMYGQYSAGKLRNMTHEEAPWKDAYAQAPSSEISHQAMTDYFKTLLN